MKLKRISLKNIRSYESQEVGFPEGSFLLSGDIGSGKTSILLAIEYALFGLQPGQKGSALLRNNSTTGEVVLEFEVDGHQIIIERRLKRESRSVSNDYSALTIDGEKKEYSTTELKTRILSLLHYPSEFIKKNNILYRYTVYTPQEQMKQIIAEDPEVRLNLLGHVFGIDKYKRTRENLVILLNHLKEDSKILQLEIKDLDEERAKIETRKIKLGELSRIIEKKQAELTDQIAKRKVVEEELRELEKKIKEKEMFEKEVEKAKIMIASKRDSMAVLDRETISLTKSLSEQGKEFNEEELKKVMNELIQKKEETEHLNSKYIELFSRIRSLDENRQKLIEKKSRVFQLDICPSCLQNVPHAHKHNIINAAENEINEIVKSVTLLENEKISTKVLLDKARLDILSLEELKNSLEILKTRTSFIERSKTRIEEINRTRENLDKDLTLLQSHLESLKGSILEFSKFNNLFKLNSEELTKNLIAEKNFEISIAELKKEIEMINKELLQVENEIKEKEASKEKLLKILELSDWLSGNFLGVINFMERSVMIKLRLEFSRLFSKWFHTLAGESFEVHLDENFTPLIIQGESEMDYSFLSGGERTAVALAYRLALNQTINSVLSNIKTKDIIILDEPTDGFSELQLDKMRDVLVDLNVPQLIIVSHEQKIEGFVENVIRFKKENGISRIE